MEFRITEQITYTLSLTPIGIIWTRNLFFLFQTNLNQSQTLDSDSWSTNASVTVARELAASPPLSGVFSLETKTRNGDILKLNSMLKLLLSCLTIYMFALC